MFWKLLSLVVFLLILGVCEILYWCREREHALAVRRASYHAFSRGYEAGYDDRAKEDDGRADVIQTANPWADDS